MHKTWQPAASLDQIKDRAKLLQKIRQFFSDRSVLEVDTPALSHSAVTDIHLHAFETNFVGPNFAKGQALYLMTSPEFHMKRLLAAGSGCIYQICKSFRNEESGRYHNPEFTMLEWYRVGFNHHQLMDEIDQLMQLILKVKPASRMTYQQTFFDVLGVCPLEAPMSDLREIANNLGLGDIAQDEKDRDTVLQLLFSVGIEAQIGQQQPAFVYDFPASQAALSKISLKDPRVAERFEVYFKGVELANGFHELDSADEQLQRFEEDNHKRERLGLSTQPIDYRLIQALEAGLPKCAGVALGIDRLMMLAAQEEHIEQVMAFPFNRA